MLLSWPGGLSPARERHCRGQGNREPAPDVLVHGQHPPRKGRHPPWMFTPQACRTMKLDTLGFGDKAVTKLSSFILPRQTKPGELLLVLLGDHHSSQVDQDVSVGRRWHRVVAQSPGVKGCGGTPGGQGIFILGEQWEVAMYHPPLAGGFPQGGGKVPFLQSGAGSGTM